MADYTEATSGVVKSGSEYLLLQKNHDDFKFWELLGGSIEEGENPLQALAREFEEELGHDFAENISDLTGFNTYRIDTVNNSYKVHPHKIKLAKRIEPELSEEHSNYKWASGAEIERMMDQDLFNRPYTQTLEYIESSDSNSEFLGRPSQDPAFEMSWDETVEQYMGPTRKDH